MPALALLFLLAQVERAEVPPPVRLSWNWAGSPDEIAYYRQHMYLKATRPKLRVFELPAPTCQILPGQNAATRPMWTCATDLPGAIKGLRVSLCIRYRTTADVCSKEQVTVRPPPPTRVRVTP